jgi:uncharacterized protein YndB with AHSA1/START domain
MTEHSVAHGTFGIERTYPAPRKRVFAAWASHAAKNAWFGEGDDFLSVTNEYTLDFRVGGCERLEGTLPGGNAFLYEAQYYDIVDDERIVACYEVVINGRRTSVSLVTVAFEDAADGTRLLMTEQGAFLDGLDSNDQRQEGAQDSLEQLAGFLASSKSADDESRRSQLMTSEPVK